MESLGGGKRLLIQFVIFVLKEMYKRALAMLKSNSLILYFIFLFWWGTPNLLAQTCCSGGVPLSSNLGLPDGEKGVLQFALSYDLNALNTLKAGRTVLDDDSGTDRSRLTHSTLLELGYSITDRFSVDLFFSWVRQERTNFFNGQQTGFTYTDGVGDPVILIKYKLLSLNQNQTTLTGGLGLKPPLGSANETFNNLRLNADLQPGSGAWDAVFWGQFTKVMPFRPSMSFAATTTYRSRGTNEDFQETFIASTGTTTAQPYRFGDEFQLIAGLSDRFLLGKQLLDPALLFRYRSARPDRIKPNREGTFNEIANTGGQWIFINPSISFWIGTTFSLNANIELPLLANITGTQVTPSYRLNIGAYYILKTKKEALLLNPN